jgi:hypothetical protein
VLVLALAFSVFYFFRSLKKPKQGEVQNAQQESLSIRDTLRPEVTRRGGHDLVEITTHYPTCAECSKYQGRVFSISGSDRRFPKLPTHIQHTQRIHEGCKHTIVPFVNSLQAANEIAAAIKRSNKPFVDSRSKTERDIHNRQQEEMALAEQDAIEYDKIKKAAPNIAPKSFAGYRRMKKAKSNNYLALVEKMKQLEEKEN